jgi:hypothetical protein
MHEISEEATTSPSEPDDAPRSGPLAAMRGNRPLRLLFAGQVVSSHGDWLYITTLVVLVYRLTGSATIAALVTAARLVPYLIFLPLGCVFADRFDRRRLMIGADLGRAGCMVALLAVHSRGTVWLAFPLAFASTCLFGVFRPALAATLPTVARGRDGLLQANALMGQIEGCPSCSGRRSPGCSCSPAPHSAFRPIRPTSCCRPCRCGDCRRRLALCLRRPQRVGGAPR